MIFVGTRQLLIVPFILSQLAWLCAPISPLPVFISSK